MKRMMKVANSGRGQATGGVVEKRGGRVIWIKDMRRARDSNGGVERDERQQWMGLLGVNCRRRSRRMKKRRSRGRRGQIGNRCDEGFVY